jgi:rhamnosyltransferase
MSNNLQFNQNKNGVLCLVVTHNGGKTIAETINTITMQSRPPDKILLIDNASSDGTIQTIRALNIQNLEITTLNLNIGVAGAFNLGIDSGIKRGYKWLWIIDQDTMCSPDCLDLLLHQVIDDTKGTLKLSALCPTVQSRSFPEINLPSYKWDGKRFINVSGDEINDPVPVHSTITSGTLYQLNALKKVGGFREDYFIDFVDHECHMRLYKAGYTMLWVQKPTVFHELGTAKKASNGEIVFVHEPWRYYYMGRNMTQGFLKLGGLPALWAFWGDAVKQMKRLQKVNGQTRTFFCFFIRGVFDAFFNKFGALKM